MICSFLMCILLCLSAPGLIIAIELKDDSEICGMLEEVDNALNLTLDNARLTDSFGNVVESEKVYIDGTKIRYVHIPPEVKPSAIVSAYIKKVEKIHIRSKPNPIKNRLASGMGFRSSSKSEDETT